jgi:hypothetical protein
MNPPYGKGMEMWIEKLKNHGNGIALIFARTETKVFFNFIWDYADAVLFVKGRIKFLGVNTKGEYVTNKAPMHDSMIVIFGEINNVK